MFIKILIGFLLVGVTVVIHAVGFGVLLKGLIRPGSLDQLDVGPVIGKVIVLTCWLIVIHLAEISVWACSMFGRGACRMRSRRFIFRQ